MNSAHFYNLFSVHIDRYALSTKQLSHFLNAIQCFASCNEQRFWLECVIIYEVGRHKLVIRLMALSMGIYEYSQLD